MSIETLLGGRLKILTFSALIVIAVGAFGDLVAAGYWWGKLNPWIMHAESNGFISVLSTLICWIFSLLALIIIILIFVFFFAVKRISESKAISILLYILLFLFTAIAIITAILGSIFGFGSDDPYSSEDSKCYPNYFSSLYEEIAAWAYRNGKMNDYLDWVSDLIFKITDLGKIVTDDAEYANKENFKLFLKSIAYTSGVLGDEKGFCTALGTALIAVILVAPFNQSLCVNVAAPTLVFGLVQAIGFIIFVIALICSCCSCCCKKEDSANQEA